MKRVLVLSAVMLAALASAGTGVAQAQECEDVVCVSGLEQFTDPVWGVVGEGTTIAGNAVDTVRQEAGAITGTVLDVIRNGGGACVPGPSEPVCVGSGGTQPIRDYVREIQCQLPEGTPGRPTTCYY